MLKDAAKMLNINYSTAKTILRVFRKERRIDKKNTKKLEGMNDIKKCKISEEDASEDEVVENKLDYNPGK